MMTVFVPIVFLAAFFCALMVTYVFLLFMVVTFVFFALRKLSELSCHVWRRKA